MLYLGSCNSDNTEQIPYGLYMSVKYVNCNETKLAPKNDLFRNQSVNMWNVYIFLVKSLLEQIKHFQNKHTAIVVFSRK